MQALPNAPWLWIGDFYVFARGSVNHLLYLCKGPGIKLTNLQPNGKCVRGVPDNIA